MPRELSTLVVQSIITNIMSKVSLFKMRIVKAIKHGNNAERYIAEACKVGLNVFDFHTAMQMLQYEGKIKYNSTIEGYELCN